MSITDELREYANRFKNSHDAWSGIGDELTAIADRIDAAHEEALSQAYMDVSDSEWIRLPKGADGVPWKPGDCDEDGNVVTELRLTSDGWFVITDGEWPYRPESHRHYHAQTVEDVLREFANEVYADADNEIRDRDFLCAKYAKRLTLAEGEDA